MTGAAIALDRLLKLRLLVARFGEMDLAGWWNTKGQRGRLKAAALRRGFPRTHRFAQARSVFGRRPPLRGDLRSAGCVTHWRLPEAVEEEFDARWELWLEGTDGKWTARKTPTRSIDELVRERTSPAVKSALKTLLEAPSVVGAAKKPRKGKANA